MLDADISGKWKAVLSVGNTSGVPVTAFWAVAASLGVRGIFGVHVQLQSLITVSFLLPALFSNNTTLGRVVREVSRKTKAGGRDRTAETKF